ncbi:hypothetical protein DNTS_029671, partial [Danionella cerebrum]
ACRMSVSLLSSAFRSLCISASSTIAPQAVCVSSCRSLMTSVCQWQNRTLWKNREKYTIRPIGMKKTGGRDHTGRIRTRGIGGGHKQRHRIIDYQRLRYEPGKENQPITEKVLEVRYDPCRSADIALVAGGNRKRWILASEHMEAGDMIKSSGAIGRMAVIGKEGDAHPVGALAVGTLVHSLEVYPGSGAIYIRAAGTCGVVLRKVNGTVIIQLPSKHQIQKKIGKAGKSRWLGRRPSSGWWKRKGGWAGRKIRPLPPLRSYLNLPPRDKS